MRPYVLVAGYRSRVRVGDPLMPGVNMGPVHHAARVAAFEAGVCRALAAGSTLLCGGRVIGANFVVGPLTDCSKCPSTHCEL